MSLGRAVGNGNNNLTIRSVDTGEERFLATSLRNVWDTRWASDSRSLLASGMTVAGNALFRVDAETGELTRLAEGRWAPKMSRDGKVMVYMGPKAGSGDATSRPARIRPSRSTPLRAFEDLSPDGREVVFEDGAPSRLRPSTEESRGELFRSPLWHVLRWTRDGRYIIAQSLDAKTGWYAATSEIWRIPVQGGTPLKLDLDIAGMENFALHPDNRRFAFGVNEGTKTELWVMENLLRPLKAVK